MRPPVLPVFEFLDTTGQPVTAAPPGLKDDLQAELQLAHVDSRARAVNGSECPGSDDGHAVRVEAIRAQTESRISEIEMVHEIECLESELEISFLGEVEVLQR